MRTALTKSDAARYIDWSSAVLLGGAQFQERDCVQYLYNIGQVSTK